MFAQFNKSIDDYAEVPFFINLNLQIRMLSDREVEDELVFNLFLMLLN
jgi:hypothetical protein